MTTATPDREVNIPLLRKAVEWAEAEAALGPRSQWLQAWWKTTPEDDPSTWGGKLRRGGVLGLQPLAEDCGTTYCIAGYICHQIGHNEPDVSWADDAIEALGISDRQGDMLFSANNTIEDVRRIAEDIAGERL